MNCHHGDVNLGNQLKEFKEFTSSFDPTMKGLTISNSEVIKEVHNSFARQQMFEFDSRLANKDDDVYHFVSYMPILGRLYELDGLKDGPVDLGQADEGDWLKTVKPVIEERIRKYSANEIHFNLMALITDRRVIYEKETSRLQDQLKALQSQEELMDTDQSAPLSVDAIQSELSRYQLLQEEENRKIKRFKVENVRRKHNYLPLIMELLKILASKGELVPLVKEAKEKALAKQEKEKQKKATEAR
nr:ubiquitin carboxyl-terminal hydrolase isozyme L5-like [Lytechinus pictus]